MEEIDQLQASRLQERERANTAESKASELTREIELTHQVRSDQIEQLKAACSESKHVCRRTWTYVDVRRHTSMYVRVRRRTSTYADIRRLTSTYVDLRRRMSTYVDVRGRTSTYRSDQIRSDQIEQLKAACLSKTVQKKIQ